VGYGNQITDVYNHAWDKILFGIVSYYSYATNILIFAAAIVVLTNLHRLEKIQNLLLAVAIYSLILIVLYWSGVWSTKVNDINEKLWYSIACSIFLHVTQPVIFIALFTVIAIKNKKYMPLHPWKNLIYLVYPTVYFGMIILLNFIPLPQHPNGIIIYGDPTNWNSSIDGSLWNLFFIPVGIIVIMSIVYGFRYVNNKWICQKGNSESVKWSKHKIIKRKHAIAEKN
jgi:hypothetical protein